MGFRCKKCTFFSETHLAEEGARVHWDASTEQKEVASPDVGGGKPSRLPTSKGHVTQKEIKSNYHLL